MHKRNVGAVIAFTAAILAPSMAVGTPVFAGTTQAKMSAIDDATLENTFSNVTLDNNDVAFAVQNTVAKKVEGQSYYAVTGDFPLNYRIYFNQYRQGTSGDIHALSTDTLVYKIEPSVGGTTDESKWPFPGIGALDRYGLQDFVENNITDFYSGGDIRCTESGNTLEIMSDAKKGILTWRDEVDLHGNPSNRPYLNYTTDSNGHSYQTSNIQIKRIEGKSGDKLKVTVYQYFNSTADQGVLDLNPYSSIECDYTNKSDGVHVESGYIYIPYTLTYDSNGGGTAPTADEYYTCDDKTVTVLGQGNMAKSDNQFLGWSESQTSLITDAANIPTDLKKAGSTFDITDDMTLYAVWADKDLVINDTKVPIYKRVVQNGEGTLPDMTFGFTFEQKSEWEGVSYVSTATPIGDKSITVTEADRYTGSDPYVGNLTGKKLYYGEYANVLSDFDPQAAGTYLYLVKEKVPATGALPNVTYTGSEYVLKVVVDSNLEISEIPTITLYKDSAGKTKADYTTPPPVFDEKQELIFYNNYGTNGGTTPTGLMTNILPFIVIGGVGIGGLTLYVMLNVKRKRKENS